MTERFSVAREIESHSVAVADEIAAWLGAGARVESDVPALPKDATESSQAVVQDLIAWLREGQRAWLWPRANHPWWGSPYMSARLFACTAVQEHLRASNLPEADDREDGPAVTDLLSRYFLHAWESRPTLDPGAPAHST